MSTHVTMKVEFSHLLDRAGKTKTFPSRWSGSIEDDGIAAYVLAAEIATPNGEMSPAVAELAALMKQIIDDLDHRGESTSFDSVAQAIHAMAQAEEVAQRDPGFGVPSNDTGAPMPAGYLPPGAGHPAPMPQGWGQDAGATAMMAAHGEASQFEPSYGVGGDMSAEELASRTSDESQDVGDHDGHQDSPDDNGDQTRRRPAPRKGKGKGK